MIKENKPDLKNNINNDISCNSPIIREFRSGNYSNTTPTTLSGFRTGNYSRTKPKSDFNDSLEDNYEENSDKKMV